MLMKLTTRIVRLKRTIKQVSLVMIALNRQKKRSLNLSKAQGFPKLSKKKTSSLMKHSPLPMMFTIILSVRI